MERKLHTLYSKKKISNSAALLARLQGHGGRIDLSNIQFQLNENLLTIIQQSPVEGIEVIEASDEECQYENINAAISPGFHCSYLRFKKQVDLYGCHFAGPAVFRHCIFEKGFNIRDAEFDERADFEEVKFEGETLFSQLTALKKFYIKHCTINQAQPGFKYSRFHEDVVILDSHFPRGLDLSSCHFQGGLQVLLSQIGQMLKLSDSETAGLLVIGGSLDGKDRQCIDELEFHDFKANGQVQLRSNDFLKKFHGARAKFASSLYINFVHFHGEKNVFAGNIFEKVVELTDCVIDCHLSFSYSTFQGVFAFQKNRIDQAELYFTGCHIQENFWFGQHHQAESTAFSGKLSLLAATVSANSIVGVFRLNEFAQQAGELMLKDMLIKGLLDIRQVNVRHLQMQGAVVPGNVQEDGSVMGAVNDRGTARLLKNEAKKINNQIGALSYYRKEVQAHARELRWRDWEDRLLLLLNQVSNNYGTSWSRGVLFTLLSSLLCFTAFWLCAGNRLVSPQPANFWATYINFIWLPNGLQGLLDTTGRLHDGIASVCFFFLGKVVIAYGIYQTVAAFRKYL